MIAEKNTNTNMATNDKTIADLIKHGYTPVSVLGEALFGSVYRCQHASGHEVAVKVVDVSKLEQATTSTTTSTGRISKKPRQLEEDPALEIEILRKVQERGGHDNVCGFIETFSEADAVYVVMELGREDLFSHVQRRADSSASDPTKNTTSHLPEAEARTLFAGVARGLAHLHSIGVAHRDLSLENVLLVKCKRPGSGGTAITVPKICDFGLAKVGVDECHHCSSAVGKRFYFAPEMRYCKRSRRSMRASSPSSSSPASPPLPSSSSTSSSLETYSYNAFTSDAWSLGVLMFILLTGFPPFDVPSSKADSTGGYAAIKRGKVEWLLAQWCPERMSSKEHRLSPMALDLLQRLLCVDPNRRASVKDVLRHPFVAGARVPSLRKSSPLMRHASSVAQRETASATTFPTRILFRCSSRAAVTPRRPSATTPKGSTSPTTSGLPDAVNILMKVDSATSATLSSNTTKYSSLDSSLQSSSSVSSPHTACSSSGSASATTATGEHLRRHSGSFIVPVCER